MTGKAPADDGGRRTLAVAAIVVVQAVAAIFFVADAIADVATEGIGAHVVIESMIAFALLAGVCIGAFQLRAMIAEARRREAALAMARGAVAEVIEMRFAQWRLTAAEADVALFALKGLEVAEIARLRGVAEGTVRAQLTRIYAKAGVSSRAELLSLFFDDLLDAPVNADRR
ncbi:MAG: LuxR C-terminal-related transcriptional regulator [Parasphingopyxis sp.]|uniref:LuxR C-terminal-related transcriptional regulator n=1 Tax=Parasphingopyxis sp. TaxID=1920299 RepID=UPI003FA134CB